MTWGPKYKNAAKAKRRSFGPDGMYGTRRYPTPFKRLRDVHVGSAAKRMYRITEWYLQYLATHMALMTKNQQSAERKLAKYRNAYNIHRERLKRYRDDYYRELSES
jgi:Na+/phosphate symporter